MNLIKKLNLNREQVSNIILILGTKILDVESTIPILRVNGSSGEFNPVMRAVIEEVNINGFRAVSYLGAAGLAYLMRDSPKTLKIAAGVQAYIAFNNLIQYSLYQAQQMPFQ